ncbi:TPA: hypothetical protein ACUI80_005258, partial [Klebsiella pneumoniae]
TPPLGSTTPEVLLRNAGDLDRAMNSEDDTWQNRGGDELPTMKGYQKQVDAITDDVFRPGIRLLKQLQRYPQNNNSLSYRWKSTVSRPILQTRLQTLPFRRKTLTLL